MSSYKYKDYVRSCIDFVRTLVIKSEAAAKAMFKADDISLKLRALKYNTTATHTEYDKTTWRYYKNLAGEYHELDLHPATRKPLIEITSLDTLEKIQFTKENLAVHRMTAKQYRIGTTYYQKLIDKHPDQYTLINGILNPIDIHKAINAEDNQILVYDDRYIEPQEITLIEDLQKVITRYYDRWDNEDYQITDDLYVPARIGILYIYLPWILMNLRYMRSRTLEAHDFHIWNFLASHNHLDVYKGYLTLYQKMWFYRNIFWVENNHGKSGMFDELIDVVMTHRGLPISGFVTESIYETMENDENVFYPEDKWRREPMNMHDFERKEGKIRSIGDLLGNEIPEATQNQKDFDRDLDEVNKKFSTRGMERLDSKVLESVVENNENAHAINRQDSDLNEWIYMTSLGLYKANIVVDNPIKGSFFSFNQKQALIVWVYGMLKIYGLIGDDRRHLIPTITATDVLRRDKPSIQTVRNLIDERITDPLYVYAADNIAPKVEAIISTETFSEFCNEVYEAKKKHRILYSAVQDAREHVQVKTIVDQYYETVICKFTDNPEYFETYFLNNGFDFSGFQKKDWVKLVADINELGLGKNFNKQLSVGDIQAMMIRLLKQLSSYSIHFIRKYTSDDLNVLDWGYLRYSDAGLKMNNIHYTQMTMLDSIFQRTKFFHKPKGSIAAGSPDHRHDDFNVKLRARKELPLDLELITDNKLRFRSQLRMPTVSVENYREVELPNRITQAESLSTWDLSKFHIHKTTEQRSSVKTTDKDELIVRGVVYVDKNYKGKE